MKQLYDQREVSRLTGISESQIRYWDRQGLITHREKDRGRLWFDFQSLVAFRTVQGFAPAGRLAAQDQKLRGKTAADHARA